MSTFYNRVLSRVNAERNTVTTNNIRRDLLRTKAQNQKEGDEPSLYSITPQEFLQFGHGKNIPDTYASDPTVEQWADISTIRDFQHDNPDPSNAGPAGKTKRYKLVADEYKRGGHQTVQNTIGGRQRGGKRNWAPVEGPQQAGATDTVGVPLMRHPDYLLPDDFTSAQMYPARPQQRGTAAGKHVDKTIGGVSDVYLYRASTGQYYRPAGNEVTFQRPADDTADGHPHEVVAVNVPNSDFVPNRAFFPNAFPGTPAGTPVKPPKQTGQQRQPTDF
jgi:hypothetical protein